jgi:hypothetical protein
MTRLSRLLRVFTSPINNSIHIFMTIVPRLIRVFTSPFTIPMIYGLDLIHLYGSC